MSAARPKRGDLVRVEWVDIHENVTGNPAEAKLARRVSYGIFLTQRRDEGIPVIVTTTTVDQHADHDSGWCIYPRACVRKIEVIRTVATL